MSLQSFTNCQQQGWSNIFRQTIPKLRISHRKCLTTDWQMFERWHRQTVGTGRAKSLSTRPISNMNDRSRAKCIQQSHVDIVVNPRSIWMTVRQLTGCTKSIDNKTTNLGITADVLNSHYAAISSDFCYVVPGVNKFEHFSTHHRMANVQYTPHFEPYCIRTGQDTVLGSISITFILWPLSDIGLTGKSKMATMTRSTYGIMQYHSFYTR